MAAWHAPDCIAAVGAASAAARAGGVMMSLAPLPAPSRLNVLVAEIEALLPHLHKTRDRGQLFYAVEIGDRLLEMKKLDGRIRRLLSYRVRCVSRQCTEIATAVRDGRIYRDVESLSPGFIRRTLDGFVADGRSPTRGALMRAAKAALRAPVVAS
jgi:hypothetical protein